MAFLIRKRKKYILENYNQLETICKGCANLTYFNIEEVPCSEYNCIYLYAKKYAKDNLSLIYPMLNKYE